MKIIVHPQRGTFKILFYDDRAVRGVGVVELSKGPKGMRPSHYRLRWANKRQFKLTPPKELIDSLRKSQVFLTRKDEEFEEFLDAFQVPVHYTDLCRMCLLEERVTPLDRKTSVKFGKKEQICPECAKRELRRELAHMGKIGRAAMGHIDELLARFRDIDKVLASVQPDEKRAGKTLYDRLEAHAVQKTASLAELPLPRGFVDAAGVEYLMPAQQMAVDAGLLYGKDLLIVSATASGKTFIGEMAGMKNYLEGRGRTLFLVPLVALAVQKYHRFDERYGKIAGAGLMIGKSRVRLKDSQQVGDRNSQAPLLVGTYEGVDHMIRTGKKFTGIGTVVIDEVQMLEDQDRGHRLDGLIARLKFLAPKAQFLYLSATIGLPKVLAKKLSATLVRYDERPVALERYLYFIEHKQKIGIIKKACAEEYAMTSSKGFHGQTIVFTHSRARCHVIADALGPGYAAYHAGLTAQERRDVEEKFLKGKLKAVVTTAALGAGVDFPASQVIFDSLAMGISWLSVQEFHQMAGRAGRPDYHDLGKVMILAEPGGTYLPERFRNRGGGGPPAAERRDGRGCPRVRRRAEFRGVCGQCRGCRRRLCSPGLDYIPYGRKRGTGGGPPDRRGPDPQGKRPTGAHAACQGDGRAFHRSGAAAGDPPPGQNAERPDRDPGGARMQRVRTGETRAGEERKEMMAKSHP